MLLCILYILFKVLLLFPLKLFDNVFFCMQVKWELLLPEIVSTFEDKELLSHFWVYRENPASAQTDKSLNTGNANSIKNFRKINFGLNTKLMVSFNNYLCVIRVHHMLLKDLKCLFIHSYLCISSYIILLHYNSY